MAQRIIESRDQNLPILAMNTTYKSPLFPKTKRFTRKGAQYSIINIDVLRHSTTILLCYQEEEQVLDMVKSQILLILRYIVQHQPAIMCRKILVEEKVKVLPILKDIHRIDAIFHYNYNLYLVLERFVSRLFSIKKASNLEMLNRKHPKLFKPIIHIPLENTSQVSIKTSNMEPSNPIKKDSQILR